MVQNSFVNTSSFSSGLQVEASSNEPVPAGEPPDDEDDDAALQTKLHEQLPPAVVTFAVYPER